MSKCSKCDKPSKISYKGEEYCWEDFDEVRKPQEERQYTQEELEQIAIDLGIVYYDDSI